MRAFLDTQAFKVFTDRNTLQQSNLFNYAIEKYNNEGDRDLKFIAEEFTKALSSPLKRIVIPLPADEKSILSSSTGCSYEINYELVRYLSSDVDSTLGPTEKQQVVEWIPHGEEEEVIVQHGLLPKISYSTWSLYEIDYVSLCINMIFSGVEMTKE